MPRQSNSSSSHDSTSTLKDVEGFEKINEYEKIFHVYKNCTWNCYPIMTDKKINKNYEGKIVDQKSILIITNLRIVLHSSHAGKSLTIEYPQVIYDRKAFRRGSVITSKNLPPELVVPWFGENYLLLKFQPGKQQPELNYIYQWVVELYCKTDIFSLKDCFSKVIFDSRMPKLGNNTNSNSSQTNEEDSILPRYEP